ncbi:MAG: hypothetical protein ACXVJ7_06535 [Acidimicrobiia bacterium]
MIGLVAVLWCVGVLTAIPFVVWWAHDFSQLPGRVWFWSGYDRRPWQWAVLLGFVFGGVVAIVTVVRWWRSEERGFLFDEVHDQLERHGHRDRSRMAGS